MTERFELLDRLGRGGMGVVWRARDTETGDIIALKKLLDVYSDDPAYLERFQREVEVTQRIASPNVVRTLGFGRHEGVPFIAMEYVDGPSLRELLKERGPYTWAEAKPLVLDAAHGLAAVHAAGIIHRDVKPSNVLVGSDGRARLADFGIARALDLTRLTGSATMLGTPHYMSPDADTTEQSDLYSLGCVTYELLTGGPPFSGDTQQAVILKHIREQPDLGRISDPEARRVLAWLLAKEPSARPGSADMLAAALAGSSSPPEKPRDVEEARRRGWGRPATVGMLGLAVTMLVAGGVVLSNISGGGDNAAADRRTEAVGTATPLPTLTPQPATATPTKIPPPSPTPTATTIRQALATKGARYTVLAGDSCASILAQAGHDTSTEGLWEAFLELNPQVGSECDNLVVGLSIEVPSDDDVIALNKIVIPVKALIRSNDDVYIGAICEGNIELLKQSFIGPALTHNEEQVRSFDRAYPCPRQDSLTIGELLIFDWTVVSATTKESWTFFSSTGCAKNDYDQSYRMRQIEGVWLIEQNEIVLTGSRSC